MLIASAQNESGIRTSTTMVRPTSIRVRLRHSGNPFYWGVWTNEKVWEIPFLLQKSSRMEFLNSMSWSRWSCLIFRSYNNSLFLTKYMISSTAWLFFWRNNTQINLENGSTITRVNIFQILTWLEQDRTNPCEEDWKDQW